MARVYDAEIAPLWSWRFGRLLLSGLTLPPRAMVLDVGCGTGYPALELLRDLDDGGRVIALDASSPMLDEARKKAGKLAGRRVFFRSESATPRLGFADDVYDLVLSNAGLHELGDPAAALSDFTRVTKPGGQVVATLPLAGTFAEAHDLLREVLEHRERTEALLRLDAHEARLPSAEVAAGWMRDAGLDDIACERDRFTLVFRGSRDFFFAPVIEHGPLPAWRRVVGSGATLRQTFADFGAAIDAYYGAGGFGVTVEVACLRGRKREAASARPRPEPHHPDAEPSALLLRTGDYDLLEHERPDADLDEPLLD